MLGVASVSVVYRRYIKSELTIEQVKASMNVENDSKNAGDDKSD